MADFEQLLEFDEGREWLRFEGEGEHEWIRSTESCFIVDMT